MQQCVQPFPRLCVKNYCLTAETKCLVCTSFCRRNFRREKISPHVQIPKLTMPHTHASSMCGSRHNHARTSRESRM